MGSEPMEMRKRQMPVQQESAAGGTVPAQQGQPGQANPRGSSACCFCWCCCCSCSWNEDRDDRNRKASYDVKEGSADCEDCPKPTVEEVRSWGQSFDKLMCCPAGRNSFRQFLRTEFSEENMLFWLACEEFSKESNKSTIEEKARVIYEDYISILSPKEVLHHLSYLSGVIYCTYRSTVSCVIAILHPYTVLAHESLLLYCTHLSNGIFLIALYPYILANGILLILLYPCILV
ncbi:regulator of G-protein signaling 20 isoform X3 [Dunckerocampus dactyliophorus]|nr:regulator of G-protein signaling 20 isoform X3 [Dunckerocampus dactyliophorus]